MASTVAASADPGDVMDLYDRVVKLFPPPAAPRLPYWLAVVGYLAATMVLGVAGVAMLLLVILHGWAGAGPWVFVAAWLAYAWLVVVKYFFDQRGRWERWERDMRTWAVNVDRFVRVLALGDVDRGFARLAHPIHIPPRQGFTLTLTISPDGAVKVEGNEDERR